MMKSRTLAVVGSLLLIFATSANADIFSKSGKITKVLVTADDTFGGCMVKLSASFGGSCTNYASFDCVGQVMPKDQAARMFDEANLAFALDRTVAIKVDSNNTYNGHCVATRLDVQPPGQ